MSLECLKPHRPEKLLDPAATGKNRHKPDFQAVLSEVKYAAFAGTHDRLL
jgi:hypothetical protein